MKTVQTLRAKAQAAGNLKSHAGADGEDGEGGATRRSTSSSRPKPETVYVPTYNPSTVYGTWWYPYPPPYYIYPPGYVVRAGPRRSPRGVVVGAAIWGNCNWGGNEININANNYNNFNKTNIQNNKFQHNAEHRKGVNYRDSATAQKYNRGGDRAGGAVARAVPRPRRAGPPAAAGHGSRASCRARLRRRATGQSRGGAIAARAAATERRGRRLARRRRRATAARAAAAASASQRRRRRFLRGERQRRVDARGELARQCEPLASAAAAAAGVAADVAGPRSTHIGERTMNDQIRQLVLAAAARAGTRAERIAVRPGAWRSRAKAAAPAGSPRAAAHVRLARGGREGARRRGARRRTRRPSSRIVGPALAAAGSSPATPSRTRSDWTRFLAAYDEKNAIAKRGRRQGLLPSATTTGPSPRRS